MALLSPPHSTRSRLQQTVVVCLGTFSFVSNVRSSASMVNSGKSIVSRYLFHLWLRNLTSPMRLTLDFKGQILKKLYLRNGKVDWHWTKEMSLYRMLDPLCDLEIRAWPWIFKVKTLKSCIPGVGWPVNMEGRGCESIGCWTHYVSFTSNLTHDLGLGFSRLNFSHIPWILTSSGTKGMWVRCDVIPTMQPWTCDIFLPVGYSTHRIHWPSDCGLMQNWQCFQPAGLLTGCPFSDLWAEGCCHSLNALLLYKSPFTLMTCVNNNYRQVSNIRRTLVDN